MNKGKYAAVIICSFSDPFMLSVQRLLGRLLNKYLLKFAWNEEGVATRSRVMCCQVYYKTK